MGDGDSGWRVRPSQVIKAGLGLAGSILVALAMWFVKDTYQTTRQLREDHARMMEHQSHTDAEIERLRDRMDAAHPANSPFKD